MSPKLYPSCSNQLRRVLCSIGPTMLVLALVLVASVDAAGAPAVPGAAAPALAARDVPPPPGAPAAPARPVSLTGGPDGFGYRFRDTATDPSVGSFFDISATGTEIPGFGDNASTVISFPFPFWYYGVDRGGANFYIASNGFVTFDSAGAGSGANVTIPSAAAPNDAMYPFWDDLDPTNALGHAGIDSAVYYQALGTAPSRRLIVQWNEVPFSPVTGGVVDEGIVTFQVQLWENGDVVFAYLDPELCTVTDCDRGAGGLATIGIESATTLPAGQTGLQYSHDTPSLLLKAGGYLDAIRFAPPLVGGFASGRISPADAQDAKVVPSTPPAAAVGLILAALAAALLAIVTRRRVQAH